MADRIQLNKQASDTELILAWLRRIIIRKGVGAGGGVAAAEGRFIDVDLAKQFQFTVPVDAVDLLVLILVIKPNVFEHRWFLAIEQGNLALYECFCVYIDISLVCRGRIVTGH